MKGSYINVETKLIMKYHKNANHYRKMIKPKFEKLS